MAASDTEDSECHRLQALVERHRASRTCLLERDAPFSGIQVLIALASYALLLTDVLRTGLGHRSIQFPRVEPDQVLPLGPFAYSVAHILSNATDGLQDNWVYKYDTTSIALRAYAEFLQLSSWPPCLLYKTPCTQRSVEVATIFRMMDSLVNAMAALKSTRRPNSLTLRTRNVWFDRIHHFILPQFFNDDIMRTNQALYYDAELLSAPDFAFCFSPTIRVRPYACRDFTSNFDATCRESDPLCEGVGRVFQHAARRVRTLQQQYPGKTIDLVVLEGQEDQGEAAFLLQGQTAYDIVMFTRIRHCFTRIVASQPQVECSTIAVDDFRYEGATLSSNVADWFVTIAILRTIGQAYAWLRLGLLVIGCFLARSAEPQYANASLCVRVAAGVRTALMIPSQVVVYGSLLPIVCYVAAHTMDSATAYDLIAHMFSTVLGIFKLDLQQFIRVSAVSMRGVWVVGITLHALVILGTRRNGWAPPKGVVGVPELAISVIACLPIMAQFRSVDFRDVRVTSISLLVHSSRVASLRKSSFENSQGFWGLLIRGNMLDGKCLLASAVVHTALLTTVQCCLWMSRKLSGANPSGDSHLVANALPTSCVSYAAGVLWPANALVVSWNGTLSTRSRATSRTGESLQDAHLPKEQQQQNSNQEWRIRAGIELRWTRMLRLKPRATVSPLPVEDMKHGPSISDVPSQRAPSQRNRQFGRIASTLDASKLDGRSDESEALVYLMNLVMLTDPITLLSVWWIQDHTICVLRSRRTDRLFFIPKATLDSNRDIPIDWSDYEVMLRVSANELSWQDLVRCG
ncbi:hypothetical protein PybrP1_009968 [[Pythium] brassicae (nom. inval.)]|nr:hypothetical protein PybrP1_009968 [[Pythium] brassicae (nom. inval.)]